MKALFSILILFFLAQSLYAQAQEQEQSKAQKSKEQAKEPPKIPLLQQHSRARVSAFADPTGTIRIKLFDNLALPIFSGNDFKNTIAQSILLTPTPFWLRWQVKEKWALESNAAGILLIGGPNLHLTHHWYESQNLAIAFKYGVSIPSWALNLGIPFGLNGFFSPSCKVQQAEPQRAHECQSYGWAINPQLAVNASLKLKSAILSSQFDIGVGILLEGQRRRALNQFGPTELLFSPLTNRYRAHLGLQYDRKILDRLRVIWQVDLYRTGDDGVTNPWYIVSHLAIDYWLGQQLYMTLGFSYWNYDQHATRWVKTEKIGNVQYEKQEKIRSQDLYPFIDFSWYF